MAMTTWRSSSVADEGRVAAPVDAGHPAGHGILVGGSVLAARASSPAAGADSHIGLVVGAGRPGHQAPAATRLGEHAVPQRGELGHRLGDGADVLDDQAGHDQPEHRRGHDHAVVGVGVEGAAVQRAGRDPQPVVGLVDPGAEAGQLGAQGREPVGLVPADVGDPADDARGVGERAQRRDHRGELAGVVQVDVDAGDAVAAADGEAGPVEHDLGAHHVEHVADEVAALGRVLRPARARGPGRR